MQPNHIANKRPRPFQEAHCRISDVIMNNFTYSRTVLRCRSELARTSFLLFGIVVSVKGNTQLWRNIHGFPNFRHPISYPFAAWIATWSNSVCRIRSHSQPHEKSHAVSGHMESSSSVYMLFHYCRITNNACRLRLPLKWNPSFF